MRLPFCDYHISEILVKATSKPLDLHLSDYFRSHKSIGAHDRRKIGETIYQMVRWKTLIDYLSGTQNPIIRLQCYQSSYFNAAKEDSSVPLPIRLGISEYLYEQFHNTYGEKTNEICQILNSVAPTTIRVNTLKISPEELMKRWEGKFEMKRCQYATNGIQFKKREPLFSLPEFKEGFFEMQDEGSQLLSELVKVKLKEHVLDYCSGSGGKTLGFAPSMQGKGQIYLHDNRPFILLEARKRLRRAGIQNAQFVLPKTPVDWLLTDVPCSGTGTLRRNPDAKWKINAEMVARLVQEQRDIVQNSLKYLKKGGYLVYATCSLLPDENENQVAYFLKNHPLTLEKQHNFLPLQDGMDGFFAAVFKKENMV